MLDAVPPAVLEQPVQPVEIVQVSQPNAEQLTPQTVAPAQSSTISAPESTPPEFSAKPNPVTPPVEAQPHAVATPQTQKSNAAAAPTADFEVINQQNAAAAAKAERLELLEQKLAEIVNQEKPLKEEKLRQNLKEAAINAAKAGRLSQARQTAQDLMLSPEMQAELLAQIKAIADREQKPTANLPQPSRSPLAPNPTTNANRRNAAPRVWAPPSYSVVPPSQSTGTYGSISPGNTSASGQTYSSLTLKGLANSLAKRMLPGNGNLSLIFPLPIPVDITSGFGWRMHPVTGDRRFHKGVDLGAPIGTPVIAAFAGKVALADWLDGYGLTIALSHNQDTQETLYAHLSEIFVKPGDVIKQGMVIGRVGSTGLSTGPHLHFEMRQLTSNGWEPVDPGAQIEIALAQLVKFLQTGQQVAITAQPSPQITDPSDLYASVPPPPTERWSITHNF